MRQNQRIILYGAILIAVLCFTAYEQYQNHIERMNAATYLEMKEKIGCGRIETDARSTDYYCDNPEAYRNGDPVPEEYMKSFRP